MNRRKTISGLIAALGAGLLGMGLPQTAAAAEINLTYAFFAPATTTGKNVAPRIAAKLDVMQISEITKVVDTSTFEPSSSVKNGRSAARLYQNFGNRLSSKRYLTVLVIEKPSPEIRRLFYYSRRGVKTRSGR